MATQRFSEAERFTVFAADAGRCFWCGIPLMYRDVQIDHCIPERLQHEKDIFEEIRINYALAPEFSLSGFENLVTCHQGCNLRKLGTIMPNSPATLFVLSELRDRAVKLQTFCRKFEEDRRRERILATVRSGLEQGTIERDEVLQVVSGLPLIGIKGAPPEYSRIAFSDQWSLVVREHDGVAGADASSWTVEEPIKAIYKVIGRIQEWISGGESFPYVTVGIGNNGQEANVSAQLHLVVRGENPMRSLNINVQTVTSADGCSFGGPSIYWQHLESFNGRGFDPRTLIMPVSLRGDRTALAAFATALNGSWHQILKLRRVSSRWEWRTVVYTHLPGAGGHLHILHDESSSGFPQGETPERFVQISAADICTG